MLRLLIHGGVRVLAGVAAHPEGAGRDRSPIKRNGGAGCGSRAGCAIRGRDVRRRLCGGCINRGRAPRAPAAIARWRRFSAGRRSRRRAHEDRARHAPHSAQSSCATQTNSARLAHGGVQRHTVGDGLVKVVVNSIEARSVISCCMAMTARGYRCAAGWRQCSQTYRGGCFGRFQRFDRGQAQKSMIGQQQRQLRGGQRARGAVVVEQQGSCPPHRAQSKAPCPTKWKTCHGPARIVRCKSRQVGFSNHSRCASHRVAAGSAPVEGGGVQRSHPAAANRQGCGKAQMRSGGAMMSGVSGLGTLNIRTKGVSRLRQRYSP